MKSVIRKVKKLLKAINRTNIKATIKYIKRNGLKNLLPAVRNAVNFNASLEIENPYEVWILNNEPNKQELELQQVYESCQSINFDIFCPKDENLLKSIEAQTYKNYTVIIKDEKSVKDVVENSLSDYIIFIEKGVVLAPFALYEIVKSIESRNSMLIYSDNDKLNSGERTQPHFKPDFAYDTVLSQNYIGKLIAVNTKFLQHNKSITQDLNENSVYDITLRTSEKTKKIEHIIKILYHETLLDMPIDTEGEIKVIKNHLDRVDTAYTSVVNGKFSGQYKINYKIFGTPLVSIVVPSKDHTDDLDKLLKSIEKSTYGNYEIVIVENNSEKEETFNYYDKITKENSKIRIVKFEIDYFNYSAIVNFGVKNSYGEYVLLLNNDIEFLTCDFIEEMLMYAQRPDVGICGVELFFPDRTIQHAGVTLGTRGLAGHRSREVKESSFTAYDYISNVQNLSAVTAACFMVRKQLYEDVLGFDEKLAVAFNDVDFCMKIRDCGYLIVYNPFVEAYHYESKSRGQDTQTPEKQRRFAREYELFVKRWSNTISKGDPYYNKNLRLDTDIRKINYNRIV